MIAEAHVLSGEKVPKTARKTCYRSQSQYCDIHDDDHPCDTRTNHYRRQQYKASYHRQ